VRPLNLRAFGAYYHGLGPRLHRSKWLDGIEWDGLGWVREKEGVRG